MGHSLIFMVVKKRVVGVLLTTLLRHLELCMTPISLFVVHQICVSMIFHLYLGVSLGVNMTTYLLCCILMLTTWQCSRIRQRRYLIIIMCHISGTVVLENNMLISCLLMEVLFSVSVSGV